MAPNKNTNGVGRNGIYGLQKAGFESGTSSRSTSAAGSTNGYFYKNASATSPSDEGRCIRCQKPTTNRCSGCDSAPNHPDDDRSNGTGIMAVKTFYCQADCQSADWAHHKATCTKLRSRRTLRQAANVLQTSFWRIRRQAYPVAINKVDVVADSTDVTIHADHTDSKGAATSLHTLSIDLFKGDKELEKAILSHAAAADAVVCLHEMARELFSSELEEVSRVQSREEAANQTGLCWSLEEVTVFPTTDKLKVSTTGHPSPHVFYPETKANEQQLSLHFLYRLTLKTDKTVWAVDVTGAQHGFPDALCPWPTYARDRCNTVDRKTVQEAHEVGYLWNEWKNGPESEKWIGEALMAEVHKSLCETAAALGGELGRLGKPGIQKERLVALDRLEAAAGRAMMSVKEHGYRMGVIGEVTENCGVHDGDSEEIGEEEKDEKEDEDGIKRETSVQNSARLGRINQLEASLDAAASSMRIVATPLACLREAHELLTLLEDDTNDKNDDIDTAINHSTPLSLLPYLHAFQVAVANSDEARAHVFAQRARMHDCATRPADHPLYGRTHAWRQSLAGIPIGLGPDDFEAWLWREDKAASFCGTKNGRTAACLASQSWR